MADPDFELILKLCEQKRWGLLRRLMDAWIHDEAPSASDLELARTGASVSHVMIRQAFESDDARLVEMSQQFLTVTAFGKFSSASGPQLERYVAFIRTQGVIFVAERLGRIEGMLGLVPLTDPIDGRTFVEECAWWVSPAYRGSSIGPRLLQSGETWIRQNVRQPTGQENRCRFIMSAPAGDTGNHVGSFLTRLEFAAVQTVYCKELELDA